MKDTNESLASGLQTGSEPEGEDLAWGPHIPDSSSFRQPDHFTVQLIVRALWIVPLQRTQ